MTARPNSKPKRQVRKFQAQRQAFRSSSSASEQQHTRDVTATVDKETERSAPVRRIATPRLLNTLGGSDSLTRRWCTEMQSSSRATASITGVETEDLDEDLKESWNFEMKDDEISDEPGLEDESDKFVVKQCPWTKQRGNQCVTTRCDIQQRVGGNVRERFVAREFKKEQFMDDLFALSSGHSTTRRSTTLR